MAYALSPQKKELSDSLTLPSSHVVREGILDFFSRRLRNWHNRYWYLLDDGTFLGYKEKRSEHLKGPIISFSTKKCQVFEIDEIEGVPAENGFTIQGIFWISAKEKVFKAPSADERQAWVMDIEAINRNLISMPTSPDIKIATELEARENYGITCTDDPQPGPSGVRRKMLQNFVTEKILGKGSYGEVLLSREAETGKLYALKILDKNLIISKDKVTNALTENRVLQKIDHQFLIKLRYSFTTADHVIFVMDFANGGDLFTHLYGSDNNGPFKEERARFYAAELCLAIGYLHKRAIIHRDIKIENVLLDDEGHIVLADFGVSKEYMSYQSRTRSICGTPQYMAPEVITENGYGRSVDWWCYGLVLYEMLTGLFPFTTDSSDSAHSIYKKILMDEVSYPPVLTREARYILQDLLNKDPFYRLGCGQQDYLEVTRHVFFQPIVWKNIKEKKMPPPFKPDVRGETDTKYFDTMYVEEPIPSPPPSGSTGAQGNVKTFDEFKDFDYTCEEKKKRRRTSDEEKQECSRTLTF